MDLTAALQEQQERLAHCVHCGFCLPACPTYIQLGDEADSPRGRLHLMGAVIEGRLDPASDAFQVHLDRCLGCRACETVCPSGVEYGYLLERARERAAEARRPSRLVRMLPGIMARPRVRAGFLAIGRMLRVTGVPALLVRVLPGRGLLGRIGLAMGMLASSRPVAGRSSALPDCSVPAGTGGPVPEGSRGRVALLEGCVQSGLFQHVNHATRLALRVNGWTVVDAPGQGCCGALHAHSGAMDGARSLARRNLDAFDAADVDHVVSNAAGCGALLREMGELLAREDRAARLGDRVRDVSELLAGEGRTPVAGAPFPVRVGYDPPCHLHHAQRVVEPPIGLLESIPELELVPIEDAEECCGGAGIYGITHPELGGAVGRRKVDRILASGCQVVATGNPGCQMQIGAGLRMRGRSLPVRHPVELLAESYRRAGWD